MENTMPVADAAENLAFLIKEVNRLKTPTSITQDGEIVAHIIPAKPKVILGRDLAKSLKNRPHLLEGDAEDFARVIKEARASIGMPEDPWA